MKEKRIRAVRVEPMNSPYETEIENELEAYQKAVGGYIECLDIDDDVCIICNEEGKINGLTLNRPLYDENGNVADIIAGTFLIVGVCFDDGEFVSLTEEQVKKYIEQFDTNMIISF